MVGDWDWGTGASDLMGLGDEDLALVPLSTAFSGLDDDCREDEDVVFLVKERLGFLGGRLLFFSGVELLDEDCLSAFLTVTGDLKKIENDPFQYSIWLTCLEKLANIPD